MSYTSFQSGEVPAGKTSLIGSIFCNWEYLLLLFPSADANAFAKAAGFTGTQGSCERSHLTKPLRRMRTHRASMETQQTPSSKGNCLKEMMFIVPAERLVLQKKWGHIKRLSNVPVHEAEL